MRKRFIKNPKQAFAVITGSQAEFYFFEQMKKDCRYRNMSVFLVEAGTLDELIRQAQIIKLRNRYPRVWAVASLSDYGKNADTIGEELDAAAKKKVNLAYADPSVSLYFALHYEIPKIGLSPIELDAEVADRVKGFDFVPEYLLYGGTEFHLKLFKNKAVAGANEAEYNRAFELTHDRGALNFVDFMNDIALYCGEGDISYNQKTID